MEMQLNPREASLVERLAMLAPNHGIDWSDSWTDEDLSDFRTASLRRLEADLEMSSSASSAER
jgi:hypothetical protein